MLSLYVKIIKIGSNGNLFSNLKLKEFNFLIQLNFHANNN